MPEYPADGLNDSAYVAGLPAVTVADALPPGCGVMVNVGCVPVPLSATLCGEFAALSVTVMVAESAPAAAGVNTTLTVHELPAAHRCAAIVGLSKAGGVGSGDSDR